MATYHFLAIHPGETLLLPGRAKPYVDGDEVSLSDAQRDSLLMAGVHFKETEPKEGEPNRVVARARFGPNRAEAAAMREAEARKAAAAAPKELAKP